MATIPGHSRSKELKCVFPLSRYCFYGPSRHYYPFGNTPAEDFLESCIETTNPSVLVLGCGDIRSCFYTLWKNFDSSISNAPKRFDGARFVLNDCSAPVIARNIIFLYLCTQLRGRDEEDIKLLCSMWAIWYCHEIYPDHSQILNTTLESLIKFGESQECWINHENPLHQIVQFTTCECLSEVCKVWKMWLNKAVRVNSGTMHKNRIKKQQMHGFHNKGKDPKFMAKHTHYIYGDNIKEVANKAFSLYAEAFGYFKKGSCYAEEVLGIQLPSRSLDVNITLHEREDGQYTCHHKLLPFHGFHHTFCFAKTRFSPVGPLPFSDFKVLPKFFESKPYLANSVQQFTMWVLSSSRVLKNTNIPISFTFDCHDAIRFCHDQVQLYYENLNPDKLVPKYDIISTSNLIDHVGLPNIVLSCVPLLKDTGLLVTTTLKMRQVEVTGEKFINTCFGFKCELLPVVLGIRCISYDGIEYSNPVFMKPTPPDPSHVSPGEVSTARTFLWMKQPASQKMVFPQLPLRERGNITNALINCVTSCSFALTRCGTPNLLCASIGIETALAILKCFISQLERYSNCFEFWEPFCHALKQTAVPLLHCLQTQMLLHNIHVHLTVSEVDCPLCYNKPLNEMLGCFQLDIDLSTYDGSSLHFVGYVHHSDESSDASMLHMKALEGEDVHIFDCFAATSSKDFKIKLNFFAPLFFSKNDYNITLTAVQKTKFVNKIALLQTAPLQSIKTVWKDYVFQSSEVFSGHLPFSGNDFEVMSHIVDQSKSETKIIIAREISFPVSSEMVCTEKVSSTIVSISCGSLKFQLHSSYPIKYEEMSVRTLQSFKFLTITCHRQPYSIQEDRPCFIVSPSHPLSIIPMELKEEMMERHAEIQISLRERAECLQNQSFQQFQQSIQVPEQNVKVFLRWMFENVSNKYILYSISSADRSCLILVNNMLFDYNHKTPAVDLAFYFLPNSNKTFPRHKWSPLWDQLPSKFYDLTKRGGHFLEAVLLYFARRTNGTVQTTEESKYRILTAQGIDSFFTRAVVYYISIDPDLRWVSPKNCILNCAFCKAANSDLIKHGAYNPSVHIPFINVPFQNFH